eukprot:TRINITY_DN16897_c0_g1_i1.p1 TRINITY_DN16897_c0_g1~~TRINITY_DN16897_c0_g1_i1.p1  ORF type:complete len:1018 (-),score=254.39 TRINITY_DN16897_c0_g1_i1:71-2839(-)
MDPRVGMPWSEAMIQEATGHHGKLLHVPEHSFLFYGTPRDAFKIEALPVVDWVGKFQPRHRKSPIAYPLGHNPENCQVQPEVKDGRVTIHEIIVMMFPVTPRRTASQGRAMFEQWKKDLKDAEKLVRNIDYEFKFWTHDRFTVKTKSACLAASAIEFLSQQPEVLDIERKLEYEPMMKYLKPMVLNGLNNATAVDNFYASGGSLLTDSNFLVGTGQVIAMADTGIMAQNCYFGGCSTVTVQTDTTFSTPANLSGISSGCAKLTGVVSRDGAFDDATFAHGTYIAGIMAGAAPIFYGNNTVAKWWEGIASGASLFVMKMYSGNLSPAFYVPASLQAGFLQWPYMNNAKIYVNAWNAINNCTVCMSDAAYANTSVISNIYNSVALDFDQFTTSNQDFISVLASGRAWCPSAPSAGVCQIAGPGNSKNVITVGASMTTSQSYNILVRNYSNLFHDPQNYSAGFPSVWNIDGSSFVGQATGSRKKPDVYAPGSHIITMNPVNTAFFSPTVCSNPGSRAPVITGLGDDLGYDYFSFGSSNAAGVVGGMLAIVRDWFARGYYSENNDNTGTPSRAIKSPSAALMKAMIIHGAVYPPSGTVVQRKVMDQSQVSTGCTTIPRFDTISDVGFGFVRLSNTILITGTKKRIYLPGRSGSFVDHSNSSLNGTFNDPVFTAAGQAHTYSFCAKPITSTDNVDPKITLVWTDRVDTTQSSGALANNLDLNVTYNKVTYFGNGGTSFDTANNVEQVSLTLSTSNIDMTVRVMATSLFSSVQPYALVVTGNVYNGSCAANPDPTVTVAATSFLSSMFLGLAALWWIIIAAGTLCCGVCCCWIYCAVFFVKTVFVKDKSSIKLVQRKVVEDVSTPDGKEFQAQVTETLVEHRDEEQVVLETPAQAIEDAAEGEAIAPAPQSWLAKLTGSTNKASMEKV